MPKFLDDIKFIDSQGKERTVSEYVPEINEQGQYYTGINEDVESASVEDGQISVQGNYYTGFNADKSGDIQDGIISDQGSYYTGVNADGSENVDESEGESGVSTGEISKQGNYYTGLNAVGEDLLGISEGEISKQGRYFTGVNAGDNSGVKTVTTDEGENIITWATDEDNEHIAKDGEIYKQARAALQEITDYVAGTPIPTSTVFFSEDVYTAYSIGSINADLNDRKILFHKDQSLQEGLINIFDKTQQPSVINPSISISITNNNSSDELGKPITSVSYSLSKSTGSYSYGYIDDNGDHITDNGTGVKWVDNPEITFDGQTLSSDSGTFENLTNIYYGSSSLTMSATQDYDAGKVAADNHGNKSNPEQKIAAGVATDNEIFRTTAKYREFYGFIDPSLNSGDNTNSVSNDLKTILKTIVSDSNYMKTRLVTTSTQYDFSVSLTGNEKDYMYFVTLDEISSITQNNVTSVSYTMIGSDSVDFENQYGKTYKLYFYRTNERLDAIEWNNISVKF